MSDPIVDFFVPGIPRSGGSKRAFKNKHTGKIVVTEQTGDRNAEWRSYVKHFAYNEYHGPPLDEPLRVTFEFRFPRPKGHFRSGRNAGLLKDSAPPFPRGQPDVTKIIRSTEDACTGVLWVDDARIVEQIARKVYADRPGCRIIVERMLVASAAVSAIEPPLFGCGCHPDREEAVAPCQP